MGVMITDIGGVFSSDEIWEVMLILNVRVITVTAENPFQNGLCEKVHAVTYTMM